MNFGSLVRHIKIRVLKLMQKLQLLGQVVLVVIDHDRMLNVVHVPAQQSQPRAAATGVWCYRYQAIESEGGAGSSIACDEGNGNECISSHDGLVLRGFQCLSHNRNSRK